MKSLWQAETTLPNYDSLKRDVKTDVLIIGGGLAGLLCAYMLKEGGVECIVAEREKICSGTSGNTTAKITSQHSFVYSKLINTYGAEFSQKYYLANERAVHKYSELCKNTDCEFERKDSFIYSRCSPAKIENELSALEMIGAKAEFAVPEDIPFDICGAVKFKNQAQFNPLKFVNQIVQGLKIYEHTPIRSFDGKAYRTDNASIFADYVIVATHFPIFNKHGFYWGKLYQNRSYVIALENAAEIDGMYMDEDEKGLSFRNSGDLLLVGGGAHRTAKNTSGWTELEHAAKAYYPSSNIKYRWAAQDCMSLDGVPYIGKYSSKRENVFVTTGFNKWGMTSSMMSAMLLSDLILGRQNEFEDIFSPSRSILHMSLASNMLHSLIGLLTPSVPRCPHLGCALKYNGAEHSWDCPCHGSRFNANNGKVINDPATDNLTQKKLRRL